MKRINFLWMCNNKKEFISIEIQINVHM
jgi:hypothetical protein